MLPAIDEKLRALVAEAEKWIGTKEVPDNRGEAVQRFQRAVDGKAQGESWCMAFAQFCVKAVDAAVEGPPAWLFESEHCLTVWNRTIMTARVQALDVKPGDLMIWQYYHGGKPTAAGHVGVVTKVLGPGKFETVEGNTSDGSGINRDGDGVYRRVRAVAGSATMRLKGFLRPWGILPLK